MKSIERSPPAIAIDRVAGPADADFDARWDAWRARGLAHERVVRRKLFVLASALAIVAAAAYSLSLMLHG